MGNKSISIKLRSACTYQRQQVVLSEWAKGWELDQKDVIDKLYKAALHHDYDEVMHMTAQLKGISDKRFVALNNVLRIITDPDRVMKDADELAETEKMCHESIENKDENDNEESSNINVDNRKNKEIPVKAAWDKTIYDDKKDISGTEINVAEIVKCYQSGMPLKEISAYNGIGHQKIVKILVTEGVFSSDVYDRIKELRLEGKSEAEIMDLTGLNKKVINMYTPYKKGIYNLSEPSKNADNIRRWRDKASNNSMV